MSASARVLIPNLGELVLAKMGCQLDQRWPESAVDVCNLAVNELANQDVGAITDSLPDTEDLVSLRVPPPAPSNWAACDSFRKAWDRPARSLKHDSMPLHERQPFFRSHVNLIMLSWLVCHYMMAWRRLHMSQCFDGVEVGGAAGGIDAKDDADADGYSQREEDRE